MVTTGGYATYMAVDVQALADRIRARREALGLSQMRAATMAGVSVVTWQKLEYANTRSPDIVTLDGVAQTLHVTIPWLLYGEGEPDAVELPLEPEEETPWQVPDALVDLFSEAMPDIPRDGVREVLAGIMALPIEQSTEMIARVRATIKEKAVRKSRRVRGRKTPT